ncbi:MAG TPA: glucosyl-3-phosphoglycerate synthase [Actinospica sp.]|nr:glucosyl-3-phosphoglycerate synthase [Actinospica sp.]
MIHHDAPSEDVRRWMERRWSRLEQWRATDVLAAKQASGTSVSVVLPALNEQQTVGEIVTRIRTRLMEQCPLVDELVVIDSGSTDRTGEVATAAGARVVHRDEILPELPAVPGKGEVLWRSLFVTTGDVVCFVDADLRKFDAALVRGILGPLLTDPSVQLVKAAYDRPLLDAGTVLPGGGGRVTELVARPLLNLHWPRLAGIVQPLAGEYAARRGLLERLPFPCGYGVELGLLVDALELAGLDALAQVDVGTRYHRHQADDALGRMSSEIWQTALRRLERAGRRLGGEPVHTGFTQFRRQDGGFRSFTYDITATERPPAHLVEQYQDRKVSDGRVA